MRIQVTTLLLVVLVPTISGYSQELDRGHRILLKHGLQLQAQVFPTKFNDVETGFDRALWDASGFTTVNLHHGNNNPGLYIGLPSEGQQWGRWVDSRDPYLYDRELIYLPNMVSIQVHDEVKAEILDPVGTGLIAYMTELKIRYPDVLIYTNQGGSQEHTNAELSNYMKLAQPHMLLFDAYTFYGHWPDKNIEYYSTSCTLYYRYLQQFRLLGLAGNDGTGRRPIPTGTYTQAFVPGNDHYISESENRLSYFAPWAFGYKFTSAFTYDAPREGWGPVVMFDGFDTSSLRPQFQYFAETNRQSRNLGPALVRLITTDIRMVMGRTKNRDGSVPLSTANTLPAEVQSWDSDADSYITSITATNLGEKNNDSAGTKLPGDVIVGYFKPLDPAFAEPGHEDDIYFMIVNGLCDEEGLAVECRQKIQLTFDFKDSRINGLLRLSRETGRVEAVSLVHHSGSLYSLDLYLDGGTGDLFKFNNGGYFVHQTHRGHSGITGNTP